ncbi:hypothetical protein CFBP5877_01990 [Agrobacterium tumefaciens]|uniref:Uncharacterized protein n=1 Tax=Agrobacterium tumefaciens TaxID=358 RepID=A0AAE6EDT2_AGRTU|nr:hypothetical protein CFBP5499_02440 [Agrobacterium tumefaciens]QCL77975.1 hypothetical protein CFBP5877_01990 [Agrobacterium tumefaciens]
MRANFQIGWRWSRSDGESGVSPLMRGSRHNKWNRNERPTHVLRNRFFQTSRSRQRTCRSRPRRRCG